MKSIILISLLLLSVNSQRETIQWQASSTDLSSGSNIPIPVPKPVSFSASMTSNDALPPIPNSGAPSFSYPVYPSASSNPVQNSASSTYSYSSSVTYPVEGSQQAEPSFSYPYYAGSSGIYPSQQGEPSFSYPVDPSAGSSGRHHKKHHKGGKGKGHHNKKGHHGLREEEENIDFDVTEDILMEVDIQMAPLLEEIFAKYNQEHERAMLIADEEIRGAVLKDLEEKLAAELMFFEEKRMAIAEEIISERLMDAIDQEEEDEDEEEEDMDNMQAGRKRKGKGKGKKAGQVVGFLVGFVLMSTILACAIKKCRARRNLRHLRFQQQIQQQQTQQIQQAQQIQHQQPHHHAVVHMPQYPVLQNHFAPHHNQNQNQMRAPAPMPPQVPQVPHQSQQQQQQQQQGMIPVQLVMVNGQMQMIPLNKNNQNALPVQQNNQQRVQAQEQRGRKYPEMQEIELQSRPAQQAPVFGTPLQYNNYQNNYQN